MEVVLDLYSQLHSEDEPLINMDEASVQLTGHVYQPLEMEPNQELYGEEVATNGSEVIVPVYQFDIPFKLKLLIVHFEE